MTVVNIIQYLKTKWKIVLPVLALIIPFASGLNTIKEAKDIVWSWFNTNENISVIQARLQPFRIRPDIKETQDELFLMMEIRNYDTSPLMIVSADIGIRGSRLATEGKAGWQSRCAFTSDANRNDPLTINPGETLWVMVGQAVLLPGLSDLMEELNVDSLHHFEPDAGVGIYEVGFVDTLNKAFERKYGKNTEIRASLYTGADKDKHTFSFRLNQGKDFFSWDGSLQHDWLLAKWIQPDNQTYLLLSKDCESRL